MICDFQRAVPYGMHVVFTLTVVLLWVCKSLKASAAQKREAATSTGHPDGRRYHVLTTTGPVKTLSTFISRVVMPLETKADDTPRARPQNYSEPQSPNQWVLVTRSLVEVLVVVLVDEVLIRRHPRSIPVVQQVAVHLEQQPARGQQRQRQEGGEEHQQARGPGATGPRSTDTSLQKDGALYSVCGLHQTRLPPRLQLGALWRREQAIALLTDDRTTQL